MSSSFETDLDLLLRVSDRVGDVAPTAPAAPARPATARKAEAPAAAIRQRWNLPGILGDTRISTNFGEVPAHLIRERDRLRTRDHGFLAVQRIEEYKIDAEFIAHRPDAAPITLPKGCIRSGLPKQNVYLSPAQKVVKLSTGVQARGIEARDLSKQYYAYDRSMAGLSYFIFHLGQPALIRSEGIWINVELA